MTGATPFGTDADWNDEDELDLADDESLPWLEAGEDEEQAAGFDTSRMILLGVVIWYNLLIWAAEWTYAAMTRARFPEERRMAPASPRGYEGDEG